jgi:tyrosine-protein phosphatase YwqE
MEDDMVLVETSTWNPPSDMTGMLRSLQKAGYRPLLAHPERYRYMNEAGYERLHRQGVLFQLNLGSLAGYYGETAMKKAQDMLAKGWYSETGSDCHRLATIKEHFNREVLTKDVLSHL